MKLKSKTVRHTKVIRHLIPLLGPMWLIRSRRLANDPEKKAIGEVPSSREAFSGVMASSQRSNSSDWDEVVEAVAEMWGKIL